MGILGFLNVGFQGVMFVFGLKMEIGELVNGNAADSGRGTDGGGQRIAVKSHIISQYGSSKGLMYPLY